MGAPMKSDTYLHIRIPAEIKELAKKQASEQGLSLSSYIKMHIILNVRAVAGPPTRKK